VRQPYSLVHDAKVFFYHFGMHTRTKKAQDLNNLCNTNIPFFHSWHARSHTDAVGNGNQYNVLLHLAQVREMDSIT